MRLATLTTESGTRAAVQDGDDYRLIGDVPDVGTLLATPGWEGLVAEGRAAVAEGGGAVAESGAASARVIPVADATEAQLITRPGKIICVGLNYRSHILEMGRDLPSHPTLFAKFDETLTGPFADIPAAPEDTDLDWEGELVVVLGRSVRRADEAQAAEAIAGYTIANDVSMRGWQFRTKEWLQGKMWEGSTPLGPVLVTADEFDRSAATVRTTVNGVVKQEHAAADLVFTPEALVAYVSTMITLNPGDIILTGTPGGVGHARTPKEYLVPGDEVTVEITGIGQIRNTIVAGG